MEDSYAVVFDFDGVIIDSRNVQIKALTESYYMFYEAGVPPYDSFFRLSGGRLEEIFNELSLPQMMVDEYRKCSVRYMDEIKVCDGMMDILTHLYNNKVKIGLCTGKDRARTMQILKKYQLLKFFDAVVCSDEVENPKPDAESLIKCLELLGSSKKYSLMVGDAINDILCARNAKVKCIAVTWGEGKKDDLVECSPYMIADSVEALSTAIDKFMVEGT